MNNKTILAFLIGAATGSVVTWKLLKTKYEQIAQEEIDSVKEVYSKKFESEDDEEPEPINEIDEKPDLSIYTKKLKDQGYLQEFDEDEEEGDSEDMEKPYVISPDELGDLDYQIVSLTYYADKILADDDNNVIEDVDNIIGLDSLNHFGEYEADSVHVRNDKKKTDYEILLDEEKYSNLYPRPLEEE